ncbi:MAG: hypothetical protein F6J87_00610 [Spirulina sp. SIO3F2]|nr:hypothetical protein [Spirulina sp. SIO3F2]
MHMINKLWSSIARTIGIKLFGHKKSTVHQAEPMSLDGTIDFTEIIIQTNREMKRLGWTKEQGRSYLIETYGKRSRQRLDDN